MNDQPCTDKRNTELLELLAELEHEQWKSWSMNLADAEAGLSRMRVNHWMGLWRPYNELTEEEKDKDREYAEKVLWVVKKYLGIK